jgi:hypothetical protein
MQHGAQLDEPLRGFKGLSCLEHGLQLKDVELLRALLSCLDKMTPSARKHLEDKIEDQYSCATADTWLALLGIKRLEMVPYMGKIVVEVPRAAWPEVRQMQSMLTDPYS